MGWSYLRSEWRRWTELGVEGWVEFGNRRMIWDWDVGAIGKGFGDEGQQKH